MTPLHWIGRTLRDLLQAVPLPMVRATVLLGLALLLLWVLRLPREATQQPEAEGAAVDLRWGAAAAIVAQIVIYALL